MVGHGDDTVEGMFGGFRSRLVVQQSKDLVPVDLGKQPLDGKNSCRTIIGDTATGRAGDIFSPEGAVFLPCQIPLW